MHRLHRPYTVACRTPVVHHRPYTGRTPAAHRPYTVQDRQTYLPYSAVQTSRTDRLTCRTVLYLLASLVNPYSLVNPGVKACLNQRGPAGYTRCTPLSTDWDRYARCTFLLVLTIMDDTVCKRCVLPIELSVTCRTAMFGTVLTIDTVLYRCGPATPFRTDRTDVAVPTGLEATGPPINLLYDVVHRFTTDRPCQSV